MIIKLTLEHLISIPLLLLDLLLVALVRVKVRVNHLPELVAGRFEFGARRPFVQQLTFLSLDHLSFLSSPCFTPLFLFLWVDRKRGARLVAFRG